MLLQYKNKDGNFVDAVIETTINIFGDVNGFIGGETKATLKVIAEADENIKNLCIRLFSTNSVNNSGSILNQYFVVDKENKQLLKSVNESNIKFKLDNQPYDNGVVFVTDTLNNIEDVESPGVFPYKEFIFTITAIVSERTVENILSDSIKNISIEFIYNE